MPVDERVVSMAPDERERLVRAEMHVEHLTKAVEHLTKAVEELSKKMTAQQEVLTDARGKLAGGIKVIMAVASLAGAAGAGAAALYRLFTQHG